MAISLPLPRRQPKNPEAELDHRLNPELNAAVARLRDLEQRAPELRDRAQHTTQVHEAAAAKHLELEELALIGRATAEDVQPARQEAERARVEAVRARVDAKDITGQFMSAQAEHARADAAAKGSAIAALRGAYRAQVQRMADALLEARTAGLETRRLYELAVSQFPTRQMAVDGSVAIEPAAGLQQVSWVELDGHEDPFNPTRLATWLHELVDAGVLEASKSEAVIAAEQQQRADASAQVVA